MEYFFGGLALVLVIGGICIAVDYCTKGVRGE